MLLGRWIGKKVIRMQLPQLQSVAPNRTRGAWTIGVEEDSRCLLEVRQHSEYRIVHNNSMHKEMQLNSGALTLHQGQGMQCIRARCVLSFNGHPINYTADWDLKFNPLLFVCF